MDYIFILSRLTLFSLSHTATVAFNTANNNYNNNNKEIVRDARTMSYISPRYYSSWLSRTQNNNVLPSVGKFSTISDSCGGLVEESLHA